MFEYGYMAGCKTHGTIADNRPDGIETREQRRQEDARARAARSHLPAIEIFR